MIFYFQSGENRLINKHRQQLKKQWKNSPHYRLNPIFNKAPLLGTINFTYSLSDNLLKT